jgi:NTP pyrophosphatase (non-canonical NTP hydrolase)
MSEGSLHSFQRQVDDLLLRHRSFLDTTSKLQEATARVNRSLMKAVTECGCLEVNARRQEFPPHIPPSAWGKTQLKSHVHGRLCENCLDVVKAEMGKNLFYLAALCNLLGIDLNDVLMQESKKLSTLGVFNFR